MGEPMPLARPVVMALVSVGAVTRQRMRPSSATETNIRHSLKTLLRRRTTAVFRATDFADNQVRLQFFAFSYNLGIFQRRLAMPTTVKH